MIAVTVDKNILIDIEEAKPNIEILVSLFRNGKISLRVPAISASEKKQDDNFSEFKTRLGNMGLLRCELLAPLAYCNLCYLDYCVVGGGNLDLLEETIQGILFPQVELEFKDYCSHRDSSSNDKRAWEKWSNKKCDVLSCGVISTTKGISCDQ